ncbi:hypothetical protein LTS08_008574 [Lithohypha guttulata]|nr:hypothetical protein LTS08_008574 [Lithohypha guttulata]
MAQLYRTLTGSSQKSGQTNGSGLAPPDLAQITTTNTRTGVLNHLSEHQASLLDEFKERLQKDDTEKWMKEQRVEELYEHFDVDFFERARTLYPQWTGHRDRRGIPVYVYEIKGLDTKSVDKYQKESAAYKAKLPNHKDLSTAPKLLPLFALYHNLLNFILPFVSTLERPKPEIPVTNSTNIVDIHGVSLRQFWNLKNHMQDASVLATAHYPETLDRIFIIGAPSFFPTVWSWIKRWFDPVTVSKIFILSKAEVTPTLEKFMDPTSIPKKYGGQLDWQWGDIPNLDAETRAALERDGNKGWVKGPALWLNGERVVVGSENGKLRRSDREIAEKKPIVYAADYTEAPVHPDKRLSVVSSGRKKSLDVATNPTANGHISKPSPSPLPEEDRQSTLPSPGTGATVSASAGATRHAQPPPAREQQAPSHIPTAEIRTAPMADLQVHLPSNQAALPATTAEYISPTKSAEQVAPPQASPSVSLPTSAPTEQLETYESRAHGAGASAAETAAATFVSSQPTTMNDISAAPPGHTQPGPLSAHTAEVSRTIARKLELESTVTIPATANGALPHPDVVVASDASKGLAMEAEKLSLSNTHKSLHAGRPQPERFVTALEVPQN